MKMFIQFNFFMLFLIPLYFIGIDGAEDIFVVFSFYFVIVQSLFIAFFIQENGASIIKMYYVFSYVFFGIVPLMEYLNGVVYWGGGDIYPDTYALTNLVIFIVNLYVYLTYRLVYSFSPFWRTIKYPNLVINDFRMIVPVALCMLSFLLLLYINNGSIISMIIRGGELKESASIDRWIGSIIGTVVRFFPFIVFLIICKNKKILILTKLLVFIIAILCASPLGMARFMVGLLYIPLLLMFIPSLIKGNKLPIFIMSCLAFVFPFLENFRNFSSTETISLTPKYDFFLSGHFDTYQSFARVIQIEFITYGYQMLGSILFFVPRSLWSTKPIGSGAEVAIQLNYSFSNVSMNYYGEAYVNFGFIGVILFATILSFFAASLDRYFKTSRDPVSCIPYYIAMAFVFVLMRGDLNVAITLFFSLAVSYKLAIFSMSTLGFLNRKNS